MIEALTFYVRNYHPRVLSILTVLEDTARDIIRTGRCDVLDLEALLVKLRDPSHKGFV
jgi:hypothetical protein